MDGVPSPSAHDPEPNPHRASSGGAWAKTAVRAILANPRYTGHQVGNRQRRDEVLIDIDDVGLGHETKNAMEQPLRRRCGPSDSVHEALVPMETFDAVTDDQGLHPAVGSPDTGRGPP